MSLTQDTNTALPAQGQPSAGPAAPITSPKPVGRMVQLDVLRGIAILLVMGRHFAVSPSQAGWLSFPAGVWYVFGWTGVDLFFVLSGFLVGGLLLGELRKYGRLDVFRFIIRRIFKIWPAYYVLVLGSIASHAMHSGWADAFHLYFFNLIHLQNYYGTDLLSHTWSLAVEEHFYLALPLLLLALTTLGPYRRTINSLPWIALAVMLLCNAARLLANSHRPFDVWTHQYPTHLRIDGLAFGVLLAYWYHFRPDFFAKIANHRRTLLLIGAALICPMLRNNLEDHPWVSTIGYTMLYVGYGLILVAFVQTPANRSGGLLGRFFASPPARFTAAIGAYSYSIYVWHLSLGRHPAQSLADWPRMASLDPTLRYFLCTAAYVAMAIIFGVILGKLIEFPALALRDRLFPSRASALRP